MTTEAAGQGPVFTEGCKPLQPLTEADVRRIVREELARQAPKVRRPTKR